MTTLSEQIKAVKREIDYRKRLYPKWVSDGKITQLEANYQIECMEQVACTLLAVQEFILKSSTIDRKALS